MTSHASGSDTPAPMAAPPTAAIVGTGQSARARSPAYASASGPGRTEQVVDGPPGAENGGRRREDDRPSAGFEHRSDRFGQCVAHGPRQDVPVRGIVEQDDPHSDLLVQLDLYQAMELPVLHFVYFMLWIWAWPGRRSSSTVAPPAWGSPLP